MAVRIRLKRMGAKNNPHFRIVVADAHSPRDGRVADEIGYYNPAAQPHEVRIDEERALAWLERGAQPTETVRALLQRAGIWQRFAQRRQAADR